MQCVPVCYAVRQNSEMQTNTVDQVANSVRSLDHFEGNVEAFFIIAEQVHYHAVLLAHRHVLRVHGRFLDSRCFIGLRRFGV